MRRSLVCGFARLCVAFVPPLMGGCQADVSLGRWGGRPSPTVIVGDASPNATTTDGESPSPSSPPSTPPSGFDASLVPEAGAGGENEAGPPTAVPELDAGNQRPACLEGLGAGAQSTLGEAFLVTETSTDWSLPEPTTGMEWTLTIEYDVAVAPGQQPTVGYYWHNQFSFVPGIAGRIGVQEHGYYDPKTGVPGSAEYTRMAVFWLSGPPLAAELGQVAESRIASEQAVGLDWLTIHAKFDWQVCHTYRFRVDVESTDADGNMWYGAWITDETDGTVTFLGRMLMPRDSGLLSTLSSSRTSPIRFAPTSCDQLFQTSAIFGAPTSATGQRAVRVADHFFQPFGCRRSLIADYEESVRHQLSVPIP